MYNLTAFHISMKESHRSSFYIMISGQSESQHAFCLWRLWKLQNWHPPLWPTRCPVFYLMHGCPMEGPNYPPNNLVDSPPSEFWPGAHHWDSRRHVKRWDPGGGIFPSGTRHITESIGSYINFCNMVLNYIVPHLIIHGNFLEIYFQATAEQLAAAGLKTTVAPPEDAETALPPEAWANLGRLGQIFWFHIFLWEARGTRPIASPARGDTDPDDADNTQAGNQEIKYTWNRLQCLCKGQSF